MSTRVRFTPFLRAGVFAGVLAGGAAHASDQPLVPQPPIATGVDVNAAAAVDLDRDGDVDLVATATGAVHWYENVGGAWTQRTVHGGAGEVLAATPADVDGDGDLDVLSAIFQANAVFWHENTAGNGSAWTLHTLATPPFPRDVRAGDVDGDGDLDVVAGSRFLVAWYENTGSPSAWTAHTVLTQVEGPAAALAVDVDGDGDLDVVTSGFGGPYISALLYWSENLAGNGTTWATHFVFQAGYGGSGHVATADLNRDGDVDLVLGFSSPTLHWFENAAGNGTTWTDRTIAAMQAEGIPSTADVDGDGDVDILGAFRGTGDDRTFWFENSAGDGSSWIRRTIATNADQGPSAVVSADLDRDGDADVLLGSHVADRLVWFRNDSIHRSACFAPAAAISTASPGAYSVTAADVDGDGAPDVVATTNEDNAVRWHENAAGNGSSWLPHTITTAALIPLSASAADVDGDGDTDVLSASFLDDKVAWYENVGGAGTSWTARTISTAVDAVGAVSPADVDGDGDTDAVTAGYYSGLRWFANTAGNGTAWAPMTIAPGSNLAEGVADLDRDGDLDVAGSTAFFDVYVDWHDNTAGNGSAWTPRTIATIGPATSYAVAPADVDRDGDPDLVVAFDLPPDASGVRWFANLDGAGGAWSTQTISTDRTFKVAVGDLDGDGDVDVLSTAYDDAAVRWHEQDGGAWMPRTIATAFTECRGVAAADLDRDGDVDVVATYPDAGRIDWFANRGGQFSLATDDVAPPSAENGTEAAMLRVVATHRGRAGDGSLELASLGLLFEEAAGDPLTSAEANAVIESLRVYRDVNGSGVFEPGTDVLVADVPTLALAAGVQTVPFTDGDANVEIAFGAPRTYFVVVALTSDASTQTPNTFRMTLLGLGPSASRAEDRTYDIPLAPACPADVASAFMGATPVTLTGFTVE
jgi:hypothetical protein